jgi:hypothetical protein
MSASVSVAGALAALICVVALVMLQRVWGGYFTVRETRFRGQLRSHAELTYIWWPFGDVTRRDLTRGFVPLVAGVSAGVLGFWVAELSAGSGPGLYHFGPAGLAVGISSAWFAAGFVLMLTIMFFNWPRLLVPPGQRGEPGAIAEWRSDRERRPHR